MDSPTPFTEELCEYTGLEISRNFHLPNFQNSAFFPHVWFRRKLCPNLIAQLAVLLVPGHWTMRYVEPWCNGESWPHDNLARLYDKIFMYIQYFSKVIWGSLCVDMMTSSNGNTSRVTVLCEGISPVASEFPSQRPVMRSFDVFFDLRLNKWLSKQSGRRWFETSSRSLWHHCNETW